MTCKEDENLFKLYVWAWLLGIKVEKCTIVCEIVKLDCVLYFLYWKKYAWKINWRSYDNYELFLKLIEWLVCGFWETLEVDLDVSWFMLFSCFCMFSNGSERVELNFLYEIRNLSIQVWKKLTY